MTPAQNIQSPHAEDVSQSQAGSASAGIDLLSSDPLAGLPAFRGGNAAGNLATPLRIGIFTESYPPVVNGVTTSVITLIERLEYVGHKVFVFTSEFPGYENDPDNVIRVPAMITPFDKAYPVPLPLTPRIVKGIAAMELDIIHSQSPFLMGLLAKYVANQQSLPLVATNHTIYTDYTHYIGFAPRVLTDISARVWIGWYYSGCDMVITPSEFAGSRLRSEYNVAADQIAVIPSGIPIAKPVADEKRNAVRVKYGIASDAPILVYAGRMAKEKNLKMLLETCEKHVFPRRPDAHLILAGAGMDAKMLQGIIDASPVLKGNVTMTGFLPRTELDPIYAAASLMTFPSGTETQGMVLGEAMAVGTPCVVVNEGGAPETVTDGIDGIRVANDPKAFGDVVVELLNNPDTLAVMRIAAISNADCRTPKMMVSKVLDVYRQATERALLRYGAEATAVLHEPSAVA